MRRDIALMTVDLSNGYPIGSVVDDGIHSPFRALACSMSIINPVESPLDSPQSRRTRRLELHDLFA